MATIKDVAEKAGVGTTTISRVINNSSLVSDKTKKKVLDAMNELNYSPNNLARGLASYSTYMIAIIMDNTMDKVYANPFIYEVFRGVEKSIYEGGYSLLLLGKDTYRNDRLAIENILHGKMVDGLILPAGLIMSDYFKKIEKYQLPIVSIGKLEKINDISNVDVDNINGGYLSAEYLYNRGYRKIAFAGYTEEKLFARDRYNGYKKFIDEKGLDIITLDKSISNADSIICLDNICAYDILKKCKELNRRIPEDIGIITFDTYPLVEYLEPNITNVEVDLYKLGIEVGNEMLRKVNKGNSNARNIRVPISINVRSSTK